MNRQSWNGSAWVNSSEEFHYGFDSSGRLHDAAFAQAYQSGQSSYSASYPAARRARAWYKYDAAGRIFSIEHWWDDWGGSSYSSTAILGADYGYDAYKGLRTSAQFKIKNPSTPSQFMNDPAWSAAETYGYDSDLDYLTEVDYNDGVSNEAQSWTYDAAGNRASDYTGSGWAYDNLNRMTDSPGSTTYQNDILGNRTGRNYTPYYSANVRLYKWDAVNRLLATAGLSAASGARYVYRADGMRIEKVTEITLQWVENPNEDDGSGFYDEITATNKPTTRYFYDGQMCVEDDQRIQMGSEWDPDVIVTRYGIGARGIDFIGYTEAEQSEVVSFPIYDGHGNMVATVKRDGTGFTCGDRRAYDAWGNIRQQTHSGYPEQRYCANLGHREDSESGLTYMRARYYEPWTGRFVSEDPDLSGWNWYSYCGNNPISRIDPTGKYEVEGDRSWFDFCFRMAMANFFAGVAFSLVGGKANSPKLGKLVQSVGQGLIMASAIWFGLALGMTDIEHFMMDLVYGAAGAFLLIAGGISVGLEASKWTNGIGIATVIVAALYSTQVLGALIGIDYW